MRKSSKILVAASAAALIAAGGAAFTNATTGMPETDTIGYGETTVSGATVNSIDYVFSTDKSDVASVSLVLDGDTTGNVVEIGFNGNAPVSCGTGTYDGMTETTYTCSGSNFPQSVAGLLSTGLFVS